MSSYGFTPQEIDPKAFLTASVNLNKDFFDILGLLRKYSLGSQGQTQSPVAAEAAGVKPTEGMA